VANQIRSELFKNNSHNRFWWYRVRENDYVPPVFQALSDNEWNVMNDWFADTTAKFPSPGEISIPGISLLSGIVGGNGISAMVQCGHYVGYSTLLLGFLFRRMGKSNCLFSIDIDSEVTEYTQAWINRAGLADQVKLIVKSSSDPLLPEEAELYLGRKPQVVFIDSSHQYQHTIDELDCWWDHIAPGGLVAMHDVSNFAKQFDSTGKGGVLPAVKAWSKRKKVDSFLLNNFVEDGMAPDTLVYRDGCGLGLIQKPMIQNGD
jgi:predicted O-methyltransferase YrrM